MVNYRGEDVVDYRVKLSVAMHPSVPAAALLLYRLPGDFNPFHNSERMIRYDTIREAILNAPKSCHKSA